MARWDRLSVLVILVLCASQYVGRTHAGRVQPRRNEDALGMETNNSAVGILALVNFISAGMDGYDALKEYQLRTNAMQDVTTEHLESIDTTLALWDGHGQRGEAWDLVRSDSLGSIESAITTMEHADKLCSTMGQQPGLVSVIKRAWKAVTDVMDKAEDKAAADKERAEDKAAADAIHAVADRFRSAFSRTMLETACPKIQDAALARLNDAESRISRWENKTKHSWFRMLGQTLGLHTGMNAPTLVNLKERCLPLELRSRVDVSHSDESITEVQISGKEALEIRLLSHEIDADLAAAEVLLGDLARHCGVPDLHANLHGKLSPAELSVQVPPGAERVLACDPYIILRGRWKTMKQLASKGKNFVVSGLAKIKEESGLGLLLDLHALSSVFRIVGDPADEVVLTVSWVALQLVTSKSPRETCRRAAAAVTGVKPVTIDELAAVDAA